MIHTRAASTLHATGPLDSRWDHHLPDAEGAPTTQARSIYYAATDAKTCLAEFFQHTRRIDRAAQSPWLVIFELAESLELIDLTGDLPPVWVPRWRFIPVREHGPALGHETFMMPFRSRTEFYIPLP
jgi:RES domain